MSDKIDEKGKWFKSKAKGKAGGEIGWQTKGFNGGKLPLGTEIYKTKEKITKETPKPKKP